MLGETPMLHTEGMDCICKGEVCGTPRLRWTCKGCKRFVPYCNGAHLGDGLDDMCDQCWVMAAKRDGWVSIANVTKIGIWEDGVDAAQRMTFRLLAFCREFWHERKHDE